MKRGYAIETIQCHALALKTHTHDPSTRTSRDTNVAFNTHFAGHDWSNTFKEVHSDMSRFEILMYGARPDCAPRVRIFPAASRPHVRSSSTGRDQGQGATSRAMTSSRDRTRPRSAREFDREFDRSRSIDRVRSIEFDRSRSTTDDGGRRRRIAGTLRRARRARARW